MAGPAFRATALPQPKKLMPNWALAGLLTSFVAGTYFYSMRAVGSEDLAQELVHEAARQDKLERQ